VKRFAHRIAAAALLALGAGLAAGADIASACSCEWWPARKRLAYSDVTFTGTAVATRTVYTQVTIPNRPPTSIEWHVATFRPVQMWKGRPQPTFEVITNPYESLCGYTFTVGTAYLVFASRASGTLPEGLELTTSLCAGTQPIDRAAADLADLGPGIPMGQACPQLAGRVPPDIIAAALDDPAAHGGWGRLANEGRPPSPYNPYRTWLSIRSPSTPYGPMNGVVWKASCR